MKVCSKCKLRKFNFDFYKHKGCEGGLRPECIICFKRIRKEYRQVDRVKINKQNQKKYRQTERGKRVHNKDSERYYKTIAGHLRHCFYAMKHRCNNSRSKAYKHYGGRGIKCQFKNADEFVNYVISELKTDPRGFDIDRIDNNGNYEKGNIRFVTRSENNKNKKR